METTEHTAFKFIIRKAERLGSGHTGGLGLCPGQISHVYLKNEQHRHFFAKCPFYT